MKKNFAPLVLIASIFAMNSCNDDDHPRIPTYIGMGTLDKPADQYTLKVDGASTCVIPDSSLLVYKQVNQPGKRVIALFNYISQRQDENSIYLQDVQGVLTKDLVNKPTAPNEDEELGYNKIRIERAWKGGGFFNVKFYYFTDGASGTPHYINAYDTGETDSDGDRIIEMRHNANKHLPIYISYASYVSFAMPVTDDKTSYKIRYYYEGKEQRSIAVDEE